jgi:hypothetical protein
MVMLSRSLLSFIVCAAIGSHSAVATSAQAQAVYFDGGQYTAALEQHTHHWRLLPMQGDDVDVSDGASACANRLHVPHGVWMVTRNTAGQPQLLAPSATLLPGGFPQQLELRACSDDVDDANVLRVPDVVLDWIKNNVSSVMIND